MTPGEHAMNANMDYMNVGTDLAEKKNTVFFFVKQKENIFFSFFDKKEKIFFECLNQLL